MRILVTGGAGFIGSHLVEELIQREHDVIVVDSFNRAYDPALKEENLREVEKTGDFELIRTDIRNLESMEAVFRTHRPQTVVHLAALAGVRPSLEKPAFYSDVNVTGTSSLLELSRKYEVKNFIFGSSSSVYGTNPKVPFSEEDPLKQMISPYAVTKRAGELLCFCHHENYGLPITCLRFFTVYGPRQRPEMAIYKFTKAVEEGTEITVFHDGKSRRDYTYVDDIIDGLMAVIDRPLQFEIINLGNSSPIKILDLITLIEKVTRKEARTRIMGPQPGDVPQTYADISKAKRLLNYIPRTGIEEGISRFVDWYRKRRT